MHNIRLPINENEKKKSNNGSMDQSPLVPEMPGTPKIRTTRPDPRKDLFPAPVAAALEVVDIVAEAVVDRTATVGAVVESAAVEQTAVVSDS